MASSTNASLNNLETTLEEYFVKKAPALPVGVKEFLVTFAPWVTAILVILAIPVVLLALGIGAVALPFAVGGGAMGMDGGLFGIIGLALSLGVLALQAMAIPGLFKRQLGAWRFIFYAQLLSLVASLLQFNLVGFLIGGLIGFYLLFQIKSYYK